MTKREEFRIAHDVSVYSLIAVARAAAPLMTEGGSIITLTYYGSTKVFPNYNVMGVAKAALEATVRYLRRRWAPRGFASTRSRPAPSRPWPPAASATLRRSSTRSPQRAPLHRNIEQQEVGNVALFLASDLASGMTGDVTFVDCGFNITGI